MSVQDYSTTPSSNTTIAGINVGEGCAPANINNAIRQLMADLAAWADTLVIGEDVQAYSAKLKAVVDLTWSANKLIYATGADTAALTDLTAKGRDLLGKADEAAMRTFLGLKALALKDMAAVGDIDVTGTPGSNTVLFGDRWAGVLGVGQSVFDLTASRLTDTIYQNTTGRPIVAYIVAISSTSAAREAQISPDGVTWVTTGVIPGSGGSRASITICVPNSWRYRVVGTVSSNMTWAELR